MNGIIIKALKALFKEDLVKSWIYVIAVKYVFRVSNQFQHKPGCTATLRLEISDLESRGIVLSMLVTA